MNPNRPPTPFEERVFEATRLIPRGKVSTYRDLADYLGCHSARAIGQALKRNPYAPEVPCHRVIQTDRSLGGFHGKTEGPYIIENRNLLREEGIRFSKSSKVEPEHCFSFERFS